jgi:tetratricopeptide (TPR) repeat protein
MEKIYFARGNIQFWYRDLDQALENIRKAAARADHLDLNTGVLALMRLGQIYDLKGRRQEAIQAYRRAIAYAPESDAAKESRRYLTTPYRRPDIPG